MAILNGVVYSKALNMDTTVYVILPHDTRPHLGIDKMYDGITASEHPKTLILLHGLTDNCGAWPYRTSIMRYAEMYDLTVIMPEVQKSFYLDLKYGSKYFTYIVDELPELASRMFNISVDPDSLLIAGLSMGGYGALLAGLSRPGKYLGIGAFSSACDIAQIVSDEFSNRKETVGWDKECIALFGPERKIPDYADLWKLAEKAAESEKKPRIYMACGNEDALLPQNEAMYAKLQELHFDTKMEIWEGNHTWWFWDVAIQKMLDHILLNK